MTRRIVLAPASLPAGGLGAPAECRRARGRAAGRRACRRVLGARRELPEIHGGVPGEISVPRYRHRLLFRADRARAGAGQCRDRRQAGQLRCHAGGQYGGLDDDDPARPHHAIRVAGICRLPGRREAGRLLGGRAGDRRHPGLQQEHPAAGRRAEILDAICCAALADRKLAIQNAAAGTQFNQIYLLERALGADYVDQTRGAASGGDGDRRADGRCGDARRSAGRRRARSLARLHAGSGAGRPGRSLPRPRECR